MRRRLRAAALRPLLTAATLLGALPAGALAQGTGTSSSTGGASRTGAASITGAPTITGAGAGSKASSRATGASGGAAIAGLAPTRPATKVPPAPSRQARGHWLTDVTITEYYPAPESWFVGKPVKAPGLSGLHRIDWLYSATGVSMEGDGIGLDGRAYHIESLGDGGWVTESGGATSPSDGWAAGAPFWRAGGFWKSRSGAVTFPLLSGGWSQGAGRRYVALPGVRFVAGPSQPLKYYQSIAVDPSVIPLGSRVYVPAYRNDGHGGWFIAQDTGGAIGGRHIDVFRPPPPTQNYSGGYLTGQRTYVIPAHN